MSTILPLLKLTHLADQDWDDQEIQRWGHLHQANYLYNIGIKWQGFKFDRYTQKFLATNFFGLLTTKLVSVTKLQQVLSVNEKPIQLTCNL